MPLDKKPKTGRGFFIGSPVIIMGIFILLFVQACGKKEKPAAPAPPTVEVVDIIQKDVPIYADWVATLDGMVNATIRAQVQGYLVQAEL